MASSRSRAAWPRSAAVSGRLAAAAPRVRAAAARSASRARRSAHLIHSIAALGPAAGEITRVHGPSAWAGDGPFWQLHRDDAKIVLLGVPYLRCTYFHVVEQLVQTPTRVFREIDAQLRRPDGTLTPLPTRAFVPTPGWRNNDFNKFGALVESRGLVRIGPVGNAVTRILRARDIVTHGVQEYRENPDLFNWTDREYTPRRVVALPVHKAAAAADRPSWSGVLPWRPSPGTCGRPCMGLKGQVV